MNKLNRPPNFKPSAQNCAKIRCPHLKSRDSIRKSGANSVITYCQLCGGYPKRLQKCPDKGEVQA
ncbi:hypothetical protein ACSAZL_01105 [Methanosarcina sp. T3]|uniref:hypothetical protein n=1 Tax=Methanosarcina sp. T3 TaxID=3439062 RepID=UPI003F85CA8E